MAKMMRPGRSRWFCIMEGNGRRRRFFVSAVAAAFLHQLTRGPARRLVAVESTAEKYSSQRDPDRALSTLSSRLTSRMTFSDRSAASSQRGRSVFLWRARRVRVRIAGEGRRRSSISRQACGPWGIRRIHWIQRVCRLTEVLFMVACWVSFGRGESWLLVCFGIRSLWLFGIWGSDDARSGPTRDLEALQHDYLAVDSGFATRMGWRIDATGT
jgi:hypothetical protein